MGSIEQDETSVEYDDIQGLVRFGYGPLTEACFLLIKIRDRQAACSWLSNAPISTAVKLEQPPATAVQVAFTREGLEALGVEETVVVGFSAEFLSGMTGQPSRSRRLGDVNANSPEYWRWGGSEKAPHLLLMLYAKPGQLESWKESMKGPLWGTAFEELDCLATTNLSGAEPFGFKDGISQPTLDWKRRRTPSGDQLEYGNVASLGEFLLGYPNEYGKYTGRPLLDSGTPHSETLPFAEDAPEKHDLGRNGAYLVFRHLQQDVQGFWKFIDQQPKRDALNPERFAESMVGRRLNGDPLTVGTQSIEGIDPQTAGQNQFTFDSDPDGVHCPLGAHIRRVNPRNADLPAGSTGLIGRLLHTLGFGNSGFRDDVMASTRFHRLLRRGREYGPMLTRQQAVSGPTDTAEHGIHFICIVANILRQFEFVQNAWVMGTKFDAMTEESDPLLGNRKPIPGCPHTDTFSVPQEAGLRDRIRDVPQFITVRGGAYFFLPSIRALRYFARAGGTPETPSSTYTATAKA
jgi:deferrochelatase/peroxidase EfeB